MKYLEAIRQYRPWNEQEAKDKELILKLCGENPDILHRSSGAAHLTASNWIVNKNRTKVLMVYHRIYDSWAWTGGHADGEEDLLAVALREAKEETGCRNVRPILEDIYSLECLTVDGHQKNGVYVPSHLHLNVTYLLEADEEEELVPKDDENLGVKWFTLEESVSVPSERWMVENIYRKLNAKLKEIGRWFSEK
ncbi:MAG TPA: NUDIX hydrolase [Acholeplasmataceae bacterium]|mgnify:FL=1|jgi:8-oxo-dGTP pyrophosphatase MutT (NUDIX family)|nr:NUDIX hydrolase [Acholeplasmataceae bacterium]